MMALFDDPLVPAQPGPLPADAEHAARCAYLTAVSAAQQHCEAVTTAARITYARAESDAWTAYQAASATAVRAWLSPPDDPGTRWFTPAAGSHPYTESEH